VYGQTGSGKTYTLTGGPERYADRGLMPRIISSLFKEINSRATNSSNSSSSSFTVSVSYFQIYNDQGYDLLSEEVHLSLDDLPRMKVLEDESGEVHLRNLSTHVALTEVDARNLLFQGDTNRVVAETAMNQVQ